MSSTDHTTWTPWRKANFDFFRTYLNPLPRSLQLVDLGAGPIQFSELFFQFQYTGVDFEKFDHVDIVTDLTKDLPLPSATADIVTLSNTIEHIPNTEHLFVECKRILKKDALIIGTVPFLLPVHQAPYDFNRYTHFQLERFLEEAGFREIRVLPLGQQIDVYNTIEYRTFDELYASKHSILITFLRAWRRLEMRLLGKLLSRIPASEKLTEGYGFVAKA